MYVHILLFVLAENNHYQTALAVVVPILVLIIIAVSLAFAIYRKSHKTVRKTKFNAIK